MEKARPKSSAVASKRRVAQRDAFFAAAALGPVVMGVLNVTPDSFSDGGRFIAPEAALAHAQKLRDDGAGIIDVGAESTRPGHIPINVEEEWSRLAPLLPWLVALDAPVSVDTMKAAIARRALDEGVCVINDIWGLQGDPDMAPVIAKAQAGVVVMHNRREVDGKIDIVADMERFFAQSLDIARHAGIAEEHIILDPGIGFGKTQPQNLIALRALPKFCEFGRPLLVGVSRKSMFGALFGVPPGERLAGTLAAGLFAVRHGARILRVHDVREHMMALDVFRALEHG